MTKDTKEIAKLVLCIVAVVSLAVVIYAMWGNMADNKKIKNTGTIS